MLIFFPVHLLFISCSKCLEVWITLKGLGKLRHLPEFCLIAIAHDRCLSNRFTLKLLPGLVLNCENPITSLLFGKKMEKMREQGSRKFCPTFRFQTDFSQFCGNGSFRELKEPELTGRVSQPRIAVSLWDFPLSIIILRGPRFFKAASALFLIFFSLCFV